MSWNQATCSLKMEVLNFVLSLVSPREVFFFTKSDDTSGGFWNWWCLRFFFKTQIAGKVSLPSKVFKASQISMDCQLSVDKVRASVWIEYHENIAGLALRQTKSFLCFWKACTNVQNLACVKLARIMFKMSSYSMKMALTVTITLIRTQVVQTNDLFVKKCSEREK